MAKGSDKEKYNSKEEVKVGKSDIRSAAKTLDGADYSGGYPQTMQHHINRGGNGVGKVKGR